MTKVKTLIGLVAFAADSFAIAGLESPDKAWVAQTMVIRCSFETGDGQDCTVEETVKIRDERGRNALGTKTLIAKQSQKLNVESAYTLQADGTKIDLSATDIQSGDVPGDNSGFLGLKFAKIAFKEVQVGSTLVARYRISGPRAEPFVHDSEDLRFVPSTIRWDKIIIDLSSDRPLYWKSRNFDALKVVAGKDGKTLHLESTAPLYFRPLEEGKDFAFRAMPLIEVSTAESWQEFLHPAAVHFGNLMTEPLPDKAKSLVSGLDKLTEEERVRRVLADVRQRIRYMGDWRETIHGYVPFSLVEIESRGFGDCKDMAMTTAALLRAAGIQANVAVVHAHIDDRKPLLPTLDYLNHAIVRANVNGKPLWLDPTSPANALSAPLFYLQNHVAFVLHDDGKVEEELIPVQDAQRDRVITEIDLTPEGESWNIVASERREGVAAATLVKEEKNQKDQDVRLAKGLIPGSATLVEQSITREMDPSNPLIDLYPFKAKVHAKRVALPNGPYQQVDYRFLTTTIGEFREYLAKDGVSDFHLSATSLDRTVRIHQRKMLEPTVACDVKSPWIDLRVEPVAVEAGVGFRAVLAKKVNWILASDMKTKAFADAVDRLELCASSMQLLLKTPL